MWTRHTRLWCLLFLCCLWVLGLGEFENVSESRTNKFKHGFSNSSRFAPRSLLTRSVGPEAAMGNMGGALGTLLGNVRDQSDRRKAISAFAGMAGAMGALFPSPVLAVLLLHELR